MTVPRSIARHLSLTAPRSIARRGDSHAFRRRLSTFARRCRCLAAALTEPADKRAMELMARGWDKTAEKQEAMQRNRERQKQLADADSF